MEYKLALALKKAGFPQKPKSEFPFWIVGDVKEPMQVPTLEELIEACGDGFSGLIKDFEKDEWQASCFVTIPESEDYEEYEDIVEDSGETILEAVANLYLKLNK